MEQLDDVKQKLTSQYDSVLQAINNQTPSNNNDTEPSTSHSLTVEKYENGNENLGDYKISVFNSFFY